jgi:protein transport protein SEC31
MPTIELASIWRTFCSVKTSARFGSVAWGAKGGSDGGGLIAGGMADGILKIWDAGRLAAGDADGALITDIERHAAAVRAMQFNPHPTSQHLFAAGSADGDVSVINLESPGEPTVASPLTAGQRLDGEVTSVAWNSSVPYILATAIQTGSVIVWDLKESKPWCTLRDPHRTSVSDVAWNPEDGLYLITASDDDLRPVLRVRCAALIGRGPSF